MFSLLKHVNHMISVPCIMYKQLYVLIFWQQTLHTTALVRRLIESQLKGQPNLRCLEFPSFFAAGFVQLSILLVVIIIGGA